LRAAYAFRELGLLKLHATVIVASIKALLSLGYVEVGRRRQHAFTAGQWHDAWPGELYAETFTWVPDEAKHDAARADGSV
jgi:RimJ/RimL family protein N-acetyltransferase